jgi:hypothetical protein
MHEEKESRSYTCFSSSLLYSWPIILELRLRRFVLFILAFFGCLVGSISLKRKVFHCVVWSKLDVWQTTTLFNVYAP